MMIPIDQATVVSIIACGISAIFSLISVAGLRRVMRLDVPLAVRDAWRAAALLGLWATNVFLASIFDPRLYIDDFQGRGLRPEALWGGLLAILAAYGWRRLRETSGKVHHD